MEDVFKAMGDALNPNCQPKADANPTMEKTETALQFHIELMKIELKYMESTDIKFGLLLSLIRQADRLLKLEQINIMDAYHAGRMQQYTDHKQSSLEFYEQKYKREAEVS